MRNILTIAIITLFLNHVTAQTKYFKGKVLSKTEDAVSYATVNILKSDTARRSILTKLTSDDGSFILPTDSLKGNYIIRITHLSYNTLKQEIDLTNQSDKIHKFSMTEKIQSLKDVTITANRPLIYRRRDKVIMDVQNNPLADVQNTYSLLQMAPGVFVMNKQISINGVFGTRIYI